MSPRVLKSNRYLYVEAHCIYFCVTNPTVYLQRQACHASSLEFRLHACMPLLSMASVLEGKNQVDLCLVQLCAANVGMLRALDIAG